MSDVGLNAALDVAVAEGHPSVVHDSSGAQRALSMYYNLVKRAQIKSRADDERILLLEAILHEAAVALAEDVDGLDIAALRAELSAAAPLVSSPLTADCKKPSCFKKRLDVEACNHGCPVSGACYSD